MTLLGSGVQSYILQADVSLDHAHIFIPRPLWYAAYPVTLGLLLNRYRKSCRRNSSGSKPSACNKPVVRHQLGLHLQSIPNICPCQEAITLLLSVEADILALTWARHAALANTANKAIMSRITGTAFIA